MTQKDYRAGMVLAAVIGLAENDGKK